MAVYRLSAQMIGRSAGRSALAAAAYRSGTQIGEHDFRDKHDVVHSEILLPDGAPAWMAERERLWRAASAAEHKVNSQEAREVTLSLPRELGREERIELVREFAREAFVSLGMVTDLSVHEPKARDGLEQPHAHCLLTTRRVEDADGFCATKERAWNDRALLLAWREAWADHVNAALERAGVAERVDHRTLEAQCREAVAAGDFGRAAEVDHDPEPKVGWRAWALERGGIATDRGDLWREVTARTEESRGLYETVAEFGTTAKARFLELRAGCRDVFQAFVAWGEEQAASLSALARGAVVAGAVGAVAVGGGLARDTPQPLTPPLEWQGTGGGTDVGSGPPGAVPETRGTTMSDEELDRMIGEMMVEDRAAVVAEAQAAEREAEDQAPAAAPAAGAAPAGMVVADEGWGRPEREAEVEVDPAAAWSMALSGGDRSAEAEARAEVEPAEAWEIGVTAGDWPAAVSDAELEGMEREEKELEAEQAAEGREGEAGDRESAEASGDEPEEQQAGEGEVEEDDPELDRLVGELEAEDRAMGEREIGGEEMEAGG